MAAASDPHLLPSVLACFDAAVPTLESKRLGPSVSERLVRFGDYVFPSPIVMAPNGIAHCKGDELKAWGETFQLSRDVFVVYEPLHDDDLIACFIPATDTRAMQSLRDVLNKAAELDAPKKTFIFDSNIRLKARSAFPWDATKAQSLSPN